MKIQEIIPFLEKIPLNTLNAVEWQVNIEETLRKSALIFGILLKIGNIFWTFTIMGFRAFRAFSGFFGLLGDF